MWRDRLCAVNRQRSQLSHTNLGAGFSGRRCRRCRDAGFASGLFATNGNPKPAYNTYRLALYLPFTSTRPGRRLEVWGDVRPAFFAGRDTHATQFVQIQFKAHSRGPFKTLGSPVPVTNPQGYIDVHVKFPSSGTLRLTWTYPKVDPNFMASAAGATVLSRYVQIKIQ